MTSGTEFSFSELLQQPSRVASAVEARGRVVLHRRNAPDLVLSRATDLTELAGFARLLAGLVNHVATDQLTEAVDDTLPWTRYLTEPGRTDFVTHLPAVIRDCDDLGTFAPLEIYMAEWRAAAAILADPELADRLARPIPHPLGQPVDTP